VSTLRNSIRDEGCQFVEGAMVVPLFAMPPPQMVFIWPIGLLLILMMVIFFVTATRTRRKRNEPHRRARLGLMGIVCGPPVGASLAWLVNRLDDVNPLDVRWNHGVFTVIGRIAGLLAGIAFCVGGLLCPQNLGGKGVPNKSMLVTDEL
jgi:hypothetical protein